MSDKGVNHLAQVIHDRSRQHAEANKKTFLDFGTIQSDNSLLTNTFPISIPPSDYLIVGYLTRGGNRLHSGDHVLVAWVQSDAVVIDVIFPANHTS